MIHPHQTGRRALFSRAKWSDEQRSGGIGEAGGERGTEQRAQRLVGIDQQLIDWGIMTSVHGVNLQAMAGRWQVRVAMRLSCWNDLLLFISLCRTELAGQQLHRMHDGDIRAVGDETGAEVQGAAAAGGAP